MKPKERLIQLKLEQVKQQYPNFPVHAIPVPKYTDKTANGLTKMIVDWINLNGYQAERINTTGTPRIERGMKDEVFNRETFQKITWTPSGATKGSADISAVIMGLSVKVEVKIGKDRQSDAQKAYEEAVKKAGGIYYIAKDFDSFIGFYDDLISKLEKFRLL